MVGEEGGKVGPGRLELLHEHVEAQHGLIGAAADGFPLLQPLANQLTSEIGEGAQFEAQLGGFGEEFESARPRDASGDIAR